jgi:hypothetical protein
MAEERASRNRVVCRARGVPAGWVVVGVYHNPACDGDGDNALIVKRPGTTEVVWLESPVPEGYDRVRPARSDHFPGDGDNAIVIRRSVSERRSKNEDPTHPAGIRR